MLGGEHLVLTDVGRDNRLAPGDLVERLHDALRGNRAVGVGVDLVREVTLPRLDALAPRRPLRGSVALRQRRVRVGDRGERGFGLTGDADVG